MPATRNIRVDQRICSTLICFCVTRQRWVRPELFCEVEYLQMTVTGKLRAPSYKGLRPDKLPEDCILEPDPSVPEGAEVRRTARSRRGFLSL